MASDDDTEGGEDEREIELSSVAAIYPEILIDSHDPFSATIDIPVEPIEPLPILFPTSSDHGTGLPSPPPSDGVSHDVIKKPVQDVHRLDYLPPLNLRINLPHGYPTQAPPRFNIRTFPPWLEKGRLETLADAGHTLWEELGRDQAVFAYIDHLREAANGGFGLAGNGDKHLSVSADLKLALLDFDLKAKRAKFEAGTYECGVCLEPKKGSKCHRLLFCGHVFCVECLQDFFNSCITEGDVGSVKCVAPKCGDSMQGKKKGRKSDRTLDPSELLQIPLTQEQVQRYITLKRKKKYESDPATVWCPRTWCQGPARSSNDKEDDSDSDEASTSDDNNDRIPNTQEQTATEEDKVKKPPMRSPAERLAICQDCNFAFCRVCKASWHGEFLYCRAREPGELSAEEKASEEYMKLHSTPCPTCNAPCQKTMGCNHMICFKCNSHFCYLCSSWLEQSNPYEHYNNPKRGCYMRLWELEGGDGGEVGIGFEGEGDFGDAGFIDDDNSDPSDFTDSESESDDEAFLPAPLRAPPAPVRGGRGGRGGRRGRAGRRG